MRIKNLTLKNFRNYFDLNISFNDKLNLIIGNNAQGKTSILESIYFLSITKSNLSVSDKTCINKNMLFSKIVGQVEDNNGLKKLEILLNSNGKKLTINNNEVKKHSDYVGKLKIIIFNPDDIRLIKETPSNRRRFVNIEISQLHSKYINVLNEYNLILKQRNEYLKSIRNGNINHVYYDIINEKLVDLAEIICSYRINYFDYINKYIEQVFMDISGYSGLKIKYIPNISVDNMDDFKKNMLFKLNNNLQREILMGSTLFGPHRDDFSFELSDNNLLEYGSQGQIKMAVLALKLSEIDVFYDICGEYPVLLLDDLFSELDVSKRNNVIHFLNRDIQTIVTTTDLKNIDKRFIKNASIYTIDNGSIIK